MSPPSFDPSPCASPVDVLLLDAGLRQSLVAARALGRRGLAVCALDTSRDAPLFSSRSCRGRFVCPGGLATTGYLDYLCRVLASLRPGVIVPSHDGTIALVRRHRVQLEELGRLALAKEPAMAIAVDKARTLEVAARLGLAVPRGVIVREVGDVPSAIKEIGLPAVIKPTESWLGDGGGGVRVVPEIVTTSDEACRRVAELTRRGGAALVQQLLLGRREAVSFLYSNGRVHARFAQWAKRTDPPLGGESVLRQSIEVPRDSGPQAERLIREIELEGYSEVEFRRDGDGIPHLMEINPRLSASVEIAVRCGVDFPSLLYQWAIGSAIDSVEGYRIGAWMRFLKGDLMATLATLARRGGPGAPPPLRAAVDFGLSCLRPMGYDYVDWRDPRPAVKATTRFVHGAIRGLIRRWKTGKPRSRAQTTAHRRGQTIRRRNSWWIST